MKICYVGNFDRNSVGEPEIAASLEELGHEVVRLDERFTNLMEVGEKMEECDLFLGAKFRVGTPKERWEFFQELKKPKITWTFDLYFGL